MRINGLRSHRPLIWLFDLDNTLHDASFAIFPAINLNMNALIARVLEAENKPAHAQAVDDIRVAYWQRYGATLLGMMKHHGVRAEDFLHAAHQFENLPGMIRAERGLVRLFRRLPGRLIRRHLHDNQRAAGFLGIRLGDDAYDARAQMFQVQYEFSRVLPEFELHHERIVGEIQKVLGTFCTQGHESTR